MELTGRQTQFYIDVVYGVLFAAGFGFLLLGGMDPRIAAFQGGLVLGYFLRVWERMSVYERILQEEVASRAEEAVAAEAHDAVTSEIDEHVAEEAAQAVTAEAEETVADEAAEAVANEVAAELDEQVEPEVAAEVERQVAEEMAAEIRERVTEEVTKQIDGEIERRIAEMPADGDRDSGREEARGT